MPPACGKVHLKLMSQTTIMLSSVAIILLITKYIGLSGNPHGLGKMS